MSPSETQAELQGRIDEEIARLDSGIRQLTVQYDMFFAGALPREPLELRRDLERIIKRHRHNPAGKYHQRFHFNSLVSRFNILSERWGKVVRTREEGVQRAPTIELPGARERLVARCAVRGGSSDEQSLRRLYDRFVEARRRTGEERAVSYQNFVRGIAGQTDRLRNSSGCAEIELRVVVRDEKVQLKARPGK